MMSQLVINHRGKHLIDGEPLSKDVLSDEERAAVKKVEQYLLINGKRSLTISSDPRENTSLPHEISESVELLAKAL